MVENTVATKILQVDGKDGGVVANPYVAEFEERLASLNPLSHVGKRVKTIPAGGVELFADKFTAAVLWFRDPNSTELLIGEDTYSEYKQDDHVEVSYQHGIPYIHNNAAFLMTVGERRFLILPEMASLKDRERELLKDTMQRYKIEAIFASRPPEDAVSVELKDEVFEGDKGSVYWLGEQDYRKFADSLVVDDWTGQFAELYGLTNYELMRLRLVGEVPWGIKPNPVFQQKLVRNK